MSKLYLVYRYYSNFKRLLTGNIFRHAAYFFYTTFVTFCNHFLLLVTL